MILILKRSWIFLLIASLAFLAINPAPAIAGAGKGIEICIKNIIPSMLPFMIIIQMLSNTGINLPPSVSSFLCGYPMGAIISQESFNKKRITLEKMQIVAAVTNNPSLGFTLGVVGATIYHSIRIGWILVGLQVVSMLIMRIIFRKKEEKLVIKKGQAEASPVHVFRYTALTIGIVCVTIIFFSSVFAILEQLRVPTFLTSFLEITNGLNFVPPLPFAAFLLGFGGISVCFQTFAVCPDVHRGKYIMLKLIQGLINALLMYLMVLAF